MQVGFFHVIIYIILYKINVIIMYFVCYTITIRHFQTINCVYVYTFCLSVIMKRTKRCLQYPAEYICKFVDSQGPIYFLYYKNQLCFTRYRNNYYKTAGRNKLVSHRLSNFSCCYSVIKAFRFASDNKSILKMYFHSFIP